MTRINARMTQNDSNKDSDDGKRHRGAAARRPSCRRGPGAGGAGGEVGNPGEFLRVSLFLRVVPSHRAPLAARAFCAGSKSGRPEGTEPARKALAALSGAFKLIPEQRAD